MHEMNVSGEIQTFAWREGSSGMLTGSIEGLYQGYRIGSTVPDEERVVMQLANGSVALILQQEISTFLPSRPAEHPFAGGRDPLASRAPMTGPPHGPGGAPAGMPAGMPAALAAPPAGVHSGGRMSGGGMPQHYMKVTVRTDPESSDGIFAGVSGEMELFTPSYRMAGYMVVTTPSGDLRLNFLENREPGRLLGDLEVDAAQSTGIYREAQGNLMFAFTIPIPPPPGIPWNYSKGTYSGTLRLEREPDKT